MSGFDFGAGTDLSQNLNEFAVFYVDKFNLFINGFGGDAYFSKELITENYSPSQQGDGVYISIFETNEIYNGNFEKLNLSLEWFDGDGEGLIESSFNGAGIVSSKIYYTHRYGPETILGPNKGFDQLIFFKYDGQDYVEVSFQQLSTFNPENDLNEKTYYLKFSPRIYYWDNIELKALAPNVKVQGELAVEELREYGPTNPTSDFKDLIFVTYSAEITDFLSQDVSFDQIYVVNIPSGYKQIDTELLFDVISLQDLIPPRSSFVLIKESYYDILKNALEDAEENNLKVMIFAMFVLNAFGLLFEIIFSD
jgi:hypothetical protein